MIRIVRIPVCGLQSQEEYIKQFKITKDNLISVTPIEDSGGYMYAIVTFDDGESD